MFNSAGPIFCRVCKPVFRRKKPEERVGVRLELVEDNYSGCGVDIASCPECKNIFQISYKVDEITKLNPKDWGVDDVTPTENE